MALWSSRLHSLSAVLDSATPLEKLKSIKTAMGLIAEKDTLKKPLEVLNWTKRVMAFLGMVGDIGLNQNESIQGLIKIINGDLDEQPVFNIFDVMTDHIHKLDDDELLSGKAAEIAHNAITHWAGLEASDHI